MPNVRVVLWWLPLLFVLHGCGEPENTDASATPKQQDDARSQVVSNTPVLDAIHTRGVLRVATRNAPTSYYHGRDGDEGFEYEMVSDFALSLGVGIEFVVREDVGSLLQLLRNGDADLVAAGLTHTPEREVYFRFGPGYQHIRQQVVCHRNGKQARSVDELTAVTLSVVSHSSYDEHLRALKKLLPELQWNAVDDVSDEDLLAEVFRKEVDCTVADSNIVSINRRYNPDLKVMFDLSEPEELAWAMPGDAQGLQEVLEHWFDEYWSEGHVQHLENKYYGYVGDFDYVDTRSFLRRIRSRLPRYQDLFKAAAAKYDFDWTLLAAQAYQESHWDEQATSPTGVKGLMMLTRTTARELEVSERTDPEEVVPAGARYLARLRSRVPPSVAEPDRTWMALAAYNMGMSHLWDARTLARKLGKEPDEWSDLKQVIPLLSQHSYYSKLQYGYARGYEAVSYVKRIRNYQDMLAAVEREGELAGQ